MPAAERTTEQGMLAAARSRLYRLLADGFAYPDRTLFKALASGGFRDDVTKTCDVLSHASDSIDGLVASGEYLEFQSEYLRLFEVSMGAPPCPLYSGVYRGGRKAVMEELTRFYNFFGLSIEHGAGELPDHITTELEFMHFLTFKELAALDAGSDATPYQRAQADFLERQLTSWLPAFEKRIEGLEPPPFYCAIAWLTNEFAQAELALLKDKIEPAPVGR